MAAIKRGPLGGGTNTPLIDRGTQTRTRSPNPGVSCATKEPSILARIGQVNRAWEIAQFRYSAQAIVRHTRQDLYDAIRGVLPGILSALGIIVVSTAVGALIGAVGGEGAGAGPGAAAGFGVGLVILDYLGLGFLVVYLVENVREVGEHFMAGAKLAWKACGENDLDPAAKEMAEGIGVFFSVIVQAVIAMVAKEGLAAAISKVSESPLGAGFGRWLRGRATLGGLLKAVENRPGQYLFAKDAAGRTVDAEGWLTRADLGTYDNSLRARIIGKLVGYHVGHLIPRVFGGPPIPENLAAMPGVTNLSYIKAVENLAGRHLEEGGVYLKVTLRYDGDSRIPSTVQHRLFRMGKDGMEMIPGGDITTNTGMIPSRPMGQVIKPRDFLSPERKPGETIH